MTDLRLQMLDLYVSPFFLEVFGYRAAMADGRDQLGRRPVKYLS
jgi:hypothetical protein